MSGVIIEYEAHVSLEGPVDDGDASYAVSINQDNFDHTLFSIFIKGVFDLRVSLDGALVRYGLRVIV